MKWTRTSTAGIAITIATITIETARRGLHAIFTDRFGWMLNQTPFHYLLVWLTVQPVDPTVTSMLARLPSALAGSLTVLVVYVLGIAGLVFVSG